MRSLPLYPTLLLIFLSCQQAQKQESAELVIAFGSCNQQDAPQPMWQSILAENPDLWIWLGDNIYGDSDIVDTLVAKYNRQLAHPEYQQLTAQTEVIGTWDDHDFGKNDAGTEFPYKAESQQAFLDFFGVPKDDPRRSRAGVYASHSYSLGNKEIKVILLDSRYHRDQIRREKRVYQPNLSGSILGAEQWEWLERELTNSQADIHIIGNGIQVIPEEHRFEKWANFPKERQRLFDLIADTRAKNVILLSGDRHIAEVSEMIDERIGYPLRDITSSGLTHSYEEAGGELNKYRISPLVGQKNYGVMALMEEGKRIKVEIALKGLNDRTYYSKTWHY